MPDWAGVEWVDSGQGGLRLAVAQEGCRFVAAPWSKPAAYSFSCHLAGTCWVVRGSSIATIGAAEEAAT